MSDPDKPWSHLGLAEDQAIYTSPTQNVRALSEDWVAAHMFCLACGAERLLTLPNSGSVGIYYRDQSSP